MSKFTQKSDSKVFGLGSTLPPLLGKCQNQSQKSASNDLDSGWTPPPLRQCPNMSRFLFRLASLTYNTQYITITLIPSFQVPKVVTEWSTDLNRKVVEGLVEGSNEVVEASDLVKLRGQKTKAPCMIHDLAP